MYRYRTAALALLLMLLTPAWAQEGLKDRVHDKYRATYTRGWFIQADTNADGHLTLQEFEAVSKRFPGRFDASRFRHADTNQDGLVSFEEAKAEKHWEIDHHATLEPQVYVHILDRIKAENAELYAALVARFDADGDGSITAAELKRLGTAYCAHKRVDGNHDGKIDPVERMRAWVDRNHDGVIGPWERRRAQAADLNDDHRVDAHERRRAAVDRNHDGTIDDTERDRARDRREDRVDRRRGSETGKGAGAKKVGASKKGGAAKAKVKKAKVKKPKVKKAKAKKAKAKKAKAKKKR